MKYLYILILTLIFSPSYPVTVFEALSDTIECPDKEIHDQFYHAIMTCDSKQIEELILKGVPVDHYSCSCFHISPLMVAIGITFFSEKLEKAGNIDPVKQLLLHGADITEKDVDDQYAFSWCILDSHKQLLEVTPTNEATFRLNPIQYKQEHPDEFDPVKRYPKLFRAEQLWLLKENNRLCLAKINKQFGALHNYLISRELGLRGHIQKINIKNGE